MRKAKLLIPSLLASLLPLEFALADADGERAVLARISHEFRAIEPLVDEANSQADPDARIKFNYDWLREDLNRIRLGIEAHIDARSTRFSSCKYSIKFCCDRFIHPARTKIKN